MKRLAILATGLLLIGCSSAPQPSTTDPTSTNQQQPTNTPGVTTSQNDTQNQGGIAPLTTAPIGSAPVTGSESLQGGGSAVGSVAKDRAKQAASSASSGSLNQAGDGE
jgi:hypothetical protein